VIRCVGGVGADHVGRPQRLHHASRQLELPTQIVCETKRVIEAITACLS
jgi:hypothetical protein